MPTADDRIRSGPPAGLSVALEFLRALGSLLLFPPRLVHYLARRRKLQAELLRDLHVEPPTWSDPTPPSIGSARREDARALRVFLSCAEASGEVHARNTLSALRRRCAAAGLPPPIVIGLGGARMAQDGVSIVGDPVRKAAMGFSAVLGSLPFYVKLLHSAARALRSERIDVCLMVDSPALHVPLGRIARRAGVPVVHFVAPQHWGWAPWRTRGYRSAVDRTLTILPFESAWFERRGIATTHVGHPLLDELADVPSRTAEAKPRTLVLLPGSRRKVIDRNLPWMLARVAELRRRAPDLRVVLPHGRAELDSRLAEHLARAGASDWVSLETGDLHASLSRASAAFAVSGTVLLDLLHHRLPTVVVYRIDGLLGPWMYANLLTAPWFAAPNLLAAEAVLPEHCFTGEGPAQAVVEDLWLALEDDAWRAGCRAGLERAARRLGPPGACDRAAAEVLALAGARLGASGVAGSRR